MAAEERREQRSQENWGLDASWVMEKNEAGH